MLVTAVFQGNLEVWASLAILWPVTIALRLDRHPHHRLPGDDPRGDLEAQQAARSTRCGENHSPGTALGSVDGRS